MICANCGKMNVEHPLCDSCTEKHLISYLRENHVKIVSEFEYTIDNNPVTPDEFSYQLFAQDTWFDLYPEKLYDAFQWFFEDAYERAGELQCTEALLWMRIVAKWPEFQKVIYDSQLNGI